jgi:hypothetical protein
VIVIPDDAPPVMSLSRAVGRLRGYEHRLYSTLPSGPLELVARIVGAPLNLQNLDPRFKSGRRLQIL